MKYDNDVFELLTTVWVYWKDKSKSNLETSLNLSRRICIFLLEHALNERVCVCIRLSSPHIVSVRLMWVIYSAFIYQQSARHNAHALYNLVERRRCRW